MTPLYINGKEQPISSNNNRRKSGRWQTVCQRKRPFLSQKVISADIFSMYLMPNHQFLPIRILLVSSKASGWYQRLILVVVWEYLHQTVFSQNCKKQYLSRSSHGIWSWSKDCCVRDVYMAMSQYFLTCMGGFKVVSTRFQSTFSQLALIFYAHPTAKFRFSHH